MQFSEADVREILSHFALPGEFAVFEPIGCGHINDTLCVTFAGQDSDRRYILQRINTHVFTKPAELMENVANVTAYLARILRENGRDPVRGTLSVFRTKDGGLYHRTQAGDCWRVYNYVEDTYTLQTIRDPQDFLKSGKAFGDFQKLLAHYPSDTLHETIPHFHDTASRYVHFQEAVQADVAGRAHTVLPEIGFVRQREADTHVLVDLLRQGELPLRVTHNDTKLNNILFDNETKVWNLFDEPRLTNDECDMLRCTMQGYTLEEIGKIMNKSVETIKFYRRQVFAKMSVRNISEAISVAVHYGFL